MKIPSFVEVYNGNKKLKPGSECPKHLEATVQKAIDAIDAQAKKLGERLGEYEGEEKVIECCSPYPEFRSKVMSVYEDARKKKAPKASPQEKAAKEK